MVLTLRQFGEIEGVVICLSNAFGAPVDRDAIEDVDAILVLTRWSEFNHLPELLKNMPNTPLVIDGRRMLDKKSIPRYEGIGLQY